MEPVSAVNMFSDLQCERVEISVIAAPQSANAILVAFERALPIKFAYLDGWQKDDARKFELGYESNGTADPQGTRLFRLVVESDPRSLPQGETKIQFADDPTLDPALRRMTTSHRPPPVVHSASVMPGDRILATYAGIPFWLRRVAAEKILDVVSVPLPILAPGESAFDHLHGGNFLPVLPLYHFLKTAVIDAGWTFPPPRACLMFDDPNLHWGSYGYISYPELIRRSRISNYHVAFATVPFDAWYTNSKAASLFKANAERVSLLMHGNNHTYAELARNGSSSRNEQLMAQAMQRVEELEARSGVKVCRTMAPPHGACSNAMMDAMYAVGVEAAFISPWSLRMWDDTRSWLPEFGLTPAEGLQNGFTVLPRFKLDANCDGSVMISALLGRPIVAVGHHHDLKNAPDLLDAAAGIVNRMPGVGWGNTEMLARSNFISRIVPNRNLMYVLPFSARIDIRVPERIHSVILTNPTFSGENRPSSWCHRQNPAESWSSHVGHGPIPVTPNTSLRLRRHALGRISPATLPSPGISLAGALRRLLCEARDRTQPLLKRPSRSNRGPDEKGY